MRVAFYVRTDWKAKPGGDVIQASEYCRAITAIGHEGRLIDSRDELRGFDVLHLFNLDRPWDVVPQAKRAMRHGIPVVLSSLAHPRQSVVRYQAERSFLIERALVSIGITADTTERLKAVARGLGSRNIPVALLAASQTAKAAKVDLWELVAGIALLSHGEQTELKNQGFNFEGKQVAVIRNGVNLPESNSFAPMNPVLKEFLSRHRRFALVGGRVEPRKNQIAVGVIAEKLRIPTIFAGQFNTRHRRYCKDFGNLVARHRDLLCYAGGIGRLEFADLMASCHMHVSASLFEVSPLVDLEARAAGKWTVSTSESMASEFLDMYSAICDPWDSQSIQNAMEIAWSAKSIATVSSVPTWAETGPKLADFYSRTRVSA